MPVFQRPPSAERDTTVMRPKDSEACLSIPRRSEDRRMEEPQSPQSTDYLIPLPSSYSLATVRSDLNSTPPRDSVSNDCCPRDRLLDDAQPPPPTTWETSFTNTPPSSLAPRVPSAVPNPVAISSRTPSHVPRTPIKDSQSTTSLLLSPPGSPTDTRPQDARERLMRPGERHDSNSMIPLQMVGSKEPRIRSHHQHYHPRYNNSGSSNSSSCAGSSSSNNSSSSAGGGGGSSCSSASTLPLDPASLSHIPPPLQYVNVDVKKRPSDYEPYFIHETREHREISC